MKENKQIEEMQKDLIKISKQPIMIDGLLHWSDVIAEELYNAGYRKQSEGEWEWFEEWSPSTPEHPRECDDCGWRCGRCKTALADVVGGYWDDAFEKPKLNHCPNCGVRMKEGRYVEV